MMNKTVFTLLLLLLPNVFYATEQHPDILLLDSKKYFIQTGWGHPNPIQRYFADKNKKYPFSMLSTANYRGHIATYSIIDNKLYLKKIEIRDSEYLPEKYILDYSEKLKDKSIFLSWFSGALSCSDEQDTYYFLIKNGRIVQHQKGKDSMNLTKKIYQNYVMYFFRLKQDRILLNSKVCSLSSGTYPLILEYFHNDHLKWPYNWENVNKCGAPNALWEIKDNKLYLNKVYLHYGTRFDITDVEELNPENVFGVNILKLPVFAGWINKICIITEYEKNVDENNLYDLSDKLVSVYIVEIRNGIVEKKYKLPENYNYNIINNLPEPIRKLFDAYSIQ